MAGADPVSPTEHAQGRSGDIRSGPWPFPRGAGFGEPLRSAGSAPILGDHRRGPSAVRPGRRNPWLWRRCASPSRTALRSRHGPHAGAGTRRTSPPSCPPRRRRARMLAQGLGCRQRSCSESRTWRRSWRKRPDSTAERRDSGTSFPALPWKAVDDEGPDRLTLRSAPRPAVDSATEGVPIGQPISLLDGSASSGAAAIG